MTNETPIQPVHEIGASSAFFIGSLVGVGCRLMLLGPGLGTLAATREPMPLCAYQAHDVVRSMPGEYFDWETKNAKLRAERSIGFEDVVFNFQRGDLVDTGNTRIPAVTAARRIFVVQRRLSRVERPRNSTSVRSRR